MELEKRLFHRRNSFLHAPRRELTFPGWFAPHVTNGRVNERHRRVQSEPRRVAGKPTVPSNGNAFAFPAPRNGHLVSQNNGSHSNSSHTNYDPPRDGRRLQSLPPHKPKADEFDSRQVRSAPNQEGKVVHGSGRNGVKVTETRPGAQPRSRISDHDNSKELPQRTHGKATRAYEEKYLRSNKFASSWAQVRADNPTFHDLSPEGSPLTARKVRQKDCSPDSNTKVNSTRDSSPSTHEEIWKEHKKPISKQHRGRTHHKTRTKTKLKFADENNNGQSPGRASNGEESDADQGSPNSEQRERKVSRKKEWVDSVIVPPYENPPPKYVSLRYLDNLTFKPTINTGKDVFQTYVSKDKKPVRENTGELYSSMSENEEGYHSPVNGSNFSQDESDDSSRERKKKEPFLNRREAIKYIKMNNVYGSDAYKNQRKEWFVQKFTEAQETKAKYGAEQRREERRKRQEDMKRQNQQLNYVRKKFRKEQEHRFRTQYVTARVLEYEQVNRHVYGLPEDFLDLANEVNRNNTDDENMTSNEQAENKVKEHKAQKHENSPKQPSQPVNKGSPTREGGQKTKTSPTKGDVKKKKEEEEAVAALAKARDNQKSWYAQPNSDPVSPTTDNRSRASHATSGYESEKHPSDNNIDNSLQTTETDRVLTHDKDAQKEQSKNKDTTHGKQNDNQAGKKRLESQKNIYASEIATRPKPQAPRQKTNVNASTQNKKPSHHTKGAAGMSGSTHESNTQKTDNDTQEISKSDKNSELAKPPSSKDYIAGQKATFPSSTNMTSQPSTNNQPNPQADTTKDTHSKSLGKSNTKESQDSAGNIPVAKTGQSSEQVGNQDSSVSKSNASPGVSTFGNTVNTKPESHNIGKETNKNMTANKQGAKSTPQTKDAHKQNGQINDKTENKNKHPLENNQTKSNTTQPGQSTDNRGTALTASPSTTNDGQNMEQQRTSSKPPHTSNFTPHPPSKSHPSHPSSMSQKPATTSSSDRNRPKTVTYEDPDEYPHQLSHPAVSIAQPGFRKDSLSSNRTPQHPQSPPKKNTPSDSNKNHQPNIVVTGDPRRQSRVESGKPDQTTKTQPKKKETVADRMFNIKTGPTWDPHKKTPKMEGIDTVVVTSKDKKGRDVKKRRDVTDVVKDADNLLKVNTDMNGKRGSSRQRRSRAVSPDLTLGSDFDVDDDDELEGDDIFERMRKKYNIVIDSDEEDGSRA